MNKLRWGKHEIELDFKRFKERIKERKLLLLVEHKQTVDPTQEHPWLVRDCFGVHLLILNSKF